MNGKAPVIVAIDAGGTSTRARAVQGERVLHRGCGGPGNPRTVDAETLQASFSDALRGCPPVDVIVACVAGAAASSMQARIRDLLRSIDGRAHIEVMPDYVAAFSAVSPRADLVVVAGTGSVVCSPDGHGGWEISGGRGWILGDEGSAARLGQALLSWYVADRGDLPDWVGARVERLVGHSDWRSLVSVVHGTPAPAALLAAAASVLTELAESGDATARRLLREEMAGLARTVVQHADADSRHRPCSTEPRRAMQAGLVGGVWSSPAAVREFAAALRELGGRVTLASTNPADPLDGAVRLARADALLV